MKEIVLEQEKKFSESLLWQLQHLAYTEFGIEAWRQKGVPFYLTSTPLLAKQYAHLAFGYLNDLEINPHEPVYLFDLGAGTGRFSYLFLKYFLQVVKGLKICLVMTDVVEKNFDFWRKHPLLEPYFKMGVLDYAYYDSTSEKPIELKMSGVRLKEGSFKNPIVLMGNYFFDTIPQDLYKVDENGISQGKVTLLAKKKLEKGDPGIIEHLECKYSYVPLEDDPDPVLMEYASQFKRATFLYPTGGLKVLEFYSRLSSEKLLLILGDHGYSTKEQVEGWEDPKISLHGSFSFSINFHFLKQYFQKVGKCGLLPTFPEKEFTVFSGVLGPKGDYQELASCYESHVNYFDPQNYYNLVNRISENDSLETLFLLLKLGDWDPVNFFHFFPKIHKLISRAENKWSVALDRVYENFYPISPEEGNLILNIGVLFFEMKNYEKAMEYFVRAREVLGRSELLEKNIARTKKLLGK